MKSKFKIIVSTSAASLVAFAGLAEQDKLNSTTDRTHYHSGRLDVGSTQHRLNDAAKASDVIGMTVQNYHNEKVGKVEDLAVDVESGRIVQVILSTGGFLGIGDTLSAVPPGALRHDAAQKILQLDVDKEKLKGAPKFETLNWAEYSDSNHLSQVYSYYGQGPAFQSIGESQTAGASNTNSTRNAYPTRDETRVPNENQSLSKASSFSQVQKASKVMGTLVKNLQDEKLGKVDNLLVDLPAGRIVAIILSSGGFLGMGDELSAIPPTVLRFTPDRDTLQLDASKEMLSSAPHFKANQWPDFAQPSYAGGVYRAYKVEPYFTSNPTTEPDNAERNVRDRNNSTLTPLDQGHSQADRDITAQIRKEIVAEKNMSMNAQNVKVITADGRVTLRGPVNTAEEKRLIGEIADRVAHSGNVDNQLEVKLAATGRN